MSIPRLELSAAVLLTRLTQHVITSLSLDKIKLRLWTDSSVTLTWLTTHSSKWKDFVANRVSFVQETLPEASWRHISGKENPADCASRGISVQQLKTHPLWWSGPPWLKLNEDQWPTSSLAPAPQAQSEARKKDTQQVLHVQSENTEEYFLTYYSDFNHLLRMTAWCLRFSLNARKAPSPYTSKHLSVPEVQDALKYWIKKSQSRSFHREINSLRNSQQIPSNSALRSLNPFLDGDGFLRVDGRLKNTTLPYDSKHPYILAQHSHLSKLIIHDCHLRTLHGGTTTTLSLIRQRFWILRGRASVRSHNLKCVTCARQRAERMTQLMGHLPSHRVGAARIFQHTGVDYAGPFTLKERRGRTRTTYKAYVALFICSATSFIHLELVTDYTAEAFIAAFKRFTGIYGMCQTLHSDQGTNFVGADRELSNLFSASSAELGQLRHLLAKDGTEWSFNPPSAPHFGGHWEAGVKSMKYHLKRVLKDSLMTYESFTTTLRQIQAVLNSRPLCRLTDDPEDSDFLTPGHFLTGGPIVTLPEPNLAHLPNSRLSYWQQTRKQVEDYWNKWKIEYLQQLQSRYKWQQQQAQVQPGTLAFIIDERYPPSKWPMAKVIKTFPGPDGLVRTVTVKTATTELSRPIQKLCLLPIAPLVDAAPARAAPPEVALKIK